MQHPSKILESLSISPLKKFGQSFLVNPVLPAWQDVFTNSHTILEIGPGLGMITQYLLEHSGPIILCEKDIILSQFLQKEYSSTHIYTNDFLHMNHSIWEEHDVRYIISNLPFNMASQIMLHIATNLLFVEKCIWGLQYEVAYRLTRLQNSFLYYFLTAFGDLTFLKKVGRNNFYPRPKVDTAWISFSRNIKIDVNRQAIFKLFLKAIFWGKRKKIINSLTGNPFLRQHSTTCHWAEKIATIQDQKAKYLLERRPEQLSFEDYYFLFTTIAF